MTNKPKKISDLPSLSPASLDTTFVVGISGSTTYKISVNQLTSSLDTTFATDLVTTALSSSLNSKLSTSSFNSYTASVTASVPNGTISGSSQITSLGFISSSTTINTGSFAITGSNTFSGSQIITGSLNVTNGITGSIRATNGVVSGSIQVLGGSGVYSGSLYAAGARFSFQDVLLGVGTTVGIISSDGNKPTLFRPNGISSNTVMQAWPLGGVSIGNAATFTYAGLALDVSGSTRYTGNISVTGSLFSSNGFTGSIAATNGIISGAAQLTLGNIPGYQTFSGSVSASNSVQDNRLINLETTTSSFSTVVNELISKTGSYATTGSNNFISSQTITGSLRVSGSLSANGLSVVTSSNVFSIQTITSASYAALTPPVSGTLYIIIG